MFGRNRKRWFCHEFIEINWSKILWVKEIRKLSKKKKTNVYKFEPQKNKNGGKKVFSINERLARMLIAFFVVKIFVYLISGNVNLTSTFAISGFVSLILFITNKIGGIDTFIFVFFVLSIFFLGGLLNETYRKRKRYKDMK